MRHLDELDCRAWAGVIVDDDPAGPDQIAEDILASMQRTTWPKWAQRLLERLIEGAIYT